MVSRKSFQVLFQCIIAVACGGIVHWTSGNRLLALPSLSCFKGFNNRDT